MGNRVFIDVVARTARLEKGLAKANRDLKKFRGQARRTGNVIRNTFGAALAFVSVRVVGGYVKSILTAVDATAKLADRIGESTENITRLQHAADITGAGAAKLSAGLDVLQKRLGEAAMGMGEGKAALDFLGLSLQSLLEMAPAEQFKTIADATSRLSSKAEQAAVTAKLFSRANQDLVNTLALGRAGLEAMGAEADALGATFTRLEAKKVEDANDAVTSLSTAFRGLTTELTISVVPALTVAATTIVTILKGLNKAAQLAGAGGLGDLLAGALKLTALGAVAPALQAGAQGGRAFNASNLAPLPLGFTQRGTGLAGITSARQPGVFGSISPGAEGIRGSFGAGLAGIRGDEERLKVIRKSAEERKKIERDLTVALKREEDMRIANANHEAAQKRDAVRDIASALVSLTSVGANESKKQFELNKKASIAEALISTAAGIARGFRELPPPLAWANAAAVGISGAAQIAAIQGTSFDGGGSAAGVAAVGAAASAGPSGPSQSVDVTFTGQGKLTREQAAEMLDEINKLLGDGATINVTNAA